MHRLIATVRRQFDVLLWGASGLNLSLLMGEHGHSGMVAYPAVSGSTSAVFREGGDLDVNRHNP